MVKFHQVWAWKRWVRLCSIRAVRIAVILYPRHLPVFTTSWAVPCQTAQLCLEEKLFPLEKTTHTRIRIQRQMEMWMQRLISIYKSLRPETRISSMCPHHKEIGRRARRGKSLITLSNISKSNNQKINIRKRKLIFLIFDEDSLSISQTDHLFYMKILCKLHK